MLCEEVVVGTVVAVLPPDDSGESVFLVVIEGVAVVVVQRVGMVVAVLPLGDCGSSVFRVASVVEYSDV